MIRVIAAMAVLVAGSLDAGAAARSYTLPTQDGQAISACLADGARCGKPAADHFCKRAGYEESILFARARVSTAIILDSELVCTGDTCEAFTRIKCYSPKGAVQANAE
jgi:hypothetical protein